MSELIQLHKLFDIEYGNGLSLNKLEECGKLNAGCVNFVSRTSKNNGVAAIVKKTDAIPVFSPGLITVAVSGSVMESFVQAKPFYTAYHVMVLTPKKEMELAEKLFYTICIRKNKYRYSYGRQANRTLKFIGVPSTIPDWVYETDIENMSSVLDVQTKNYSSMPLQTDAWKSFKYKELFIIKKGKRITNRQVKPGSTPFIRPLNHSNGYSDWIDMPPNHKGNTITVNYDSQGGVGEAFYQPIPYFAIDSVNVLYPKFDLTPEIAMFLVTLIRKERFRYSYGRKWHLERMKESIIKLPVGEDGLPDWSWIQNFISSLGFSSLLIN